MIGFKPGSSSIGSDSSATCGMTTAQVQTFLIKTEQMQTDIIEILENYLVQTNSKLLSCNSCRALQSSLDIPYISIHLL